MWTKCATPLRPGCFWKSWRRSSFFPRPVGQWFRLRLLFLLRHQRQRRLRLHPLVPPEIIIHGYIYDVETGHLALSEEANKIGAARG